ncbi:uncharacterized protein [Elaeis guineensis]|uniref:Transcription factor TEOSINTE BRANCHED 1-like n=1 Tax=Elaeis guineensis var. tenera TaxID=51953 RepID=A0A6I9QX95_ELAGV|nr:transcription factor TEOSINTE BRANCHED 1-like [Elaeis guineensis]
MLPFPDPQNFMERSISQVELNPPPPKPEHSNFFFPFSPSNVNSDDLHDMLSTHPILPFAASMASIPQPPPSTLPSNVNSIATTTPPMRSSTAVRKDRHNKILTAMGPRDRRMRLSLEVARKFFDLQDMLGFDRASKTVQWLLTTSKAAIEKLTVASRPGDRAFTNESHRNIESSTSECEDVSTVSDHKGKSLHVVATSGTEAKRPSAKRAKQPRKAAFHPNIARENRTRARARARERTREKKWMSSAMSKDGGNQWASSSLPLVTIEEESDGHDLKSSLDLVAEVEERCSSMPNQHDKHSKERAPEVPLEGGSLPISILDYGHNFMSINDTISIFQEQWDMEGTPRPWEAFNNSSIA